MKFKAPLRSIPYLAKETFDDLGLSVVSIVVAVLALIFIFSDGMDIPTWTQSAVKSIAVTFILFDVLVRCITFEVTVSSGEINYYCRGLVNTKKRKVNVLDISNLSENANWHYRLLNLTALELFSVGSSKSLMGRVVLSKSDSIELQKQLGLTSEAIEGEEQDISVSKRWSFFTLALMPWRRRVSKASYAILMTATFFVMTLVDTDGDIEESATQVYSKNNVDVEAMVDEIPNFMELSLTENIEFLQLLSVLVLLYIFITITVGWVSSKWWEIINVKISSEGQFLIIKSGVFNKKEVKIDSLQVSSYTIDANWVLRRTGRTVLKLHNRDDGGSWESPLLALEDVKKILSWMSLPDLDEGKIFPTKEGSAAFLMKVGLSAKEMYPITIIMIALALYLPNLMGILNGDALGMSSNIGALGYNIDSNSYVFINLALVAVGPFTLLYTIVLPKVMNIWVARLSEVDKVVYAYTQEDTRKVSVFNADESYVIDCIKFGGAEREKHYVGKVEYLSIKKV